MNESGFENVAELARLRFAAANQIQIKLIESSLPEGADRVEYASEWIRKISSLFREVFNQLTAEYPNLIDEWNPDSKTSANEIEDTPERKKILELFRERMGKMGEGKLDHAA